MTLRIVQVEEVQGLLRRAASVVELYEHKSPDFVGAVHAWLKTGEDVLEQNRLHAVNQIAQCRALLLSAQRGIRPPGIEILGKATKRKLVEASALQSLRDACAVMDQAVTQRVKELEEAAKLVRQIVVIARAKGLVPDGRRSGQDQLSAYRGVLSADADLAPYWVAANGLVADFDMLVLIDRALAEQDRSNMDQMTRRHRLLAQAKRDFHALAREADLKRLSRRTATAFDYAAAPVAHPGTSKHGTGYALDIAGDNPFIRDTCKRLGATLVFDEKSHVHVEFKNGAPQSVRHSG